MSLEVEKYIEMVNDTITRYKEAGDVIRQGDIAPDKIGKCLAKYLDNVLALHAEYQRAKIDLQDLTLSYDEWYDAAFLQARNSVLRFYADVKSVKPSVKEYEIQLRVDNAAAYRTWQEKLRIADDKVQFLLRVRESLAKLDQILITLSANLRTEMRALSIEDRGAKAGTEKPNTAGAPMRPASKP